MPLRAQIALTLIEGHSTASAMIADIDAVSGPRETRAELIRVAIEREITRRIRTHHSKNQANKTAPKKNKPSVTR